MHGKKTEANAENGKTCTAANGPRTSERSNDESGEHQAGAKPASRGARKRARRLIRSSGSGGRSAACAAGVGRDAEPPGNCIAGGVLWGRRIGSLLAHACRNLQRST